MNRIGLHNSKVITSKPQHPFHHQRREGEEKDGKQQLAYTASVNSSTRSVQKCQPHAFLCIQARLYYLSSIQVCCTHHHEVCKINITTYICKK